MVAIDGPGGSGKSTVAGRLAARLGLAHLDTGAMYRGLTYAVLRDGMNPADAAAVSELARRTRIELADGRVGGAVTVDGRDASGPIRGPAVTATVSAVSAHPGVREEMVRRQRRWVEDRGGAVVEGRDIGTVVFPGAALKVYLTASEAERAKRRAAETAGLDGESAPAAAEAARDLARRDRLDSSRAVSPLAVAEGAVVIDTTDLSVEEIVDQLVGRL